MRTKYELISAEWEGVFWLPKRRREMRCENVLKSSGSEYGHVVGCLEVCNKICGSRQAGGFWKR
jgi:hypothetical protein